MIYLYGKDKNAFGNTTETFRAKNKVKSLLQETKYDHLTQAIDSTADLSLQKEDILVIFCETRTEFEDYSLQNTLKSCKDKIEVVLYFVCAYPFDILESMRWIPSRVYSSIISINELSSFLCIDLSKKEDAPVNKNISFAEESIEKPTRSTAQEEKTRVTIKDKKENANTEEINEEQYYQIGLSFYKKSDWKNAKVYFEMIPAYKDTIDYLNQIEIKLQNIETEQKYQMAKKDYKINTVFGYKAALKKFIELGNYRDSIVQVELCKKEIEKIEKHSNASNEYFAKLENQYNMANMLFHNAKSQVEFEKAKNIFFGLGTYKDSQKMVQKCEEEKQKLQKTPSGFIIVLIIFFVIFISFLALFNA